MRAGATPAGRRAGAPAAGPGGRWLVALPAWGERCVGVLIRYTLPALSAALRELGKPATLIVWTDQEHRIIAEMPTDQPEGTTVSIRGVPGPDGAFESMSNCHRQILAEAAPSDRVLLLTADMVVSREVLVTCEQLVASGKQLVCCAALRALEDAGCPVGASGRELLAWAWANRHPMTRECTWPAGRSYDVWRMYFERAGEVAARVFLPHPLVVVPGGRQLAFRPTIDVNLTSNFSQAQTYMLTGPEEGAAVELSPFDKDFLMTTTMRARLDAGGPSCPPLIRATNLHHRMFFGRRVTISGAGGDCGDGEVVGGVLG